MKKVLLSILLALFMGGSTAVAQAPYGATLMGGQMWTTTGAIAGLSEAGLRVSHHKLIWKVMSGTISSCTVQIQTSSDNVTFSNVGAAQTCTADGTYTLYGTAGNFVRYNLSAFAGTLSPQVGIGLLAFAESGSGGPLSGTVITASITPTATAAAIATVTQTFTYTGLVSGDFVSLIKYPAPTSLCPAVGVRATATDTLSIDFLVLTASACTPAAGSYSVLVLR